MVLSLGRRVKDLQRRPVQYFIGKFDFLSHGKGKNLTYEHLWGTGGRPFNREGEVVRSKRGFYMRFNRKNAWDRTKLFIQEGCSPEQSVRKAGFYCRCGGHTELQC